MTDSQIAQAGNAIVALADATGKTWENVMATLEIDIIPFDDAKKICNWIEQNTN